MSTCIFISAKSLAIVLRCKSNLFNCISNDSFFVSYSVRIVSKSNCNNGSSFRTRSPDFLYTSNTFEDTGEVITSSAKGTTFPVAYTDTSTAPSSTTPITSTATASSGTSSGSPRPPTATSTSPSTCRSPKKTPKPSQPQSWLLRAPTPSASSAWRTRAMPAG